MNELNPVGKCVFCNEIYPAKEIAKHLKSHFKKRKEEGVSYLIKVEEDTKNSPYFLYLQVSHKTKMSHIDDYLRKIWLDCCGHMSDFDGVAKNKKAAEVFQKNLKLGYEYDFGSTTYLKVTFLEELNVSAEKNVVLLSRNEPLKYICQTCKKEPATQLCSIHNYDEDWLFCDECAEKHAEECEDFDDYAAMSIVNSPRMGVCGYEGGSIDTERDGVYKITL